MSFGGDAMAKKMHKGSRREERSYNSVSFDLEEDALEIFLQYLEEDNPPDDYDEMPHTKKKIGKRQKKQSVCHINLDLHGHTVEEAKKRIDAELYHLREKNRGMVGLRIITGRGLHSGLGGAILITEVYDYVQGKYQHLIVSIDDPPVNLKIGDIPLKGHFDVVFHFK